MACPHFYHLLRGSEGLLPDRLIARLLEPHAARCAECQAYRARRERLEALLRQTLREAAAAYVAPPALRERRAVEARRNALSRRGGFLRPALALGLAAAGAVALSVSWRSGRPPVGRPMPLAVAPAVAGDAGHRGQKQPERAWPRVALRSKGDNAFLPRAGRQGAERPRAKGASPGAARRSARRQTAPAPPREARPSRLCSLRPRAPVMDDLASINADPEATLRQWAAVPLTAWERIEARVRRTVRVRDDFVQLPFPRLASTAPRQMVAAVEQYKKDAAIVDPRLSREVTLAVKGMAFSELCDRLRADTGIEISAGPSVADEKVTIFCENRPLREVMREINHVFAFSWLRSGEPGKYRYELTQDLRSRLAEEELRNRDLNEALADLDDKMTAYRPYLQKSLDQLREEERQATGPEKEQLRMLAREGGLAALQVYNHLTPDQFAALKSGVDQKFGYSPWDTNRLPDDWRASLLQSMPAGLAPRAVVPGVMTWAVREGASPVDQPGIMPFVILRINRSELGTVSLEAETGMSDSTQSGWPGLASHHQLATGQSPSAAKPGNEKANEALRRQPLFQRLISLRPQPSCPRLKREAARQELAAPVVPLDQFRRAQQGVRAATGEQDPTELPHVTSADVWEAVHKATGQPIVADSYTRIYPIEPVTVEKATVFDALCQVANEIGARWKKEGDFLLCRSTGYFWNRLKEVPNRLLARWQVDGRQKDGLPLADVIEMASLSENQLDSGIVAQAIEHCWELEEWGLVGGQPRENQQVRPYARFLAFLTPDQRARSVQPGGLPVRDLSQPQQQELTRVWTERGWPTQDLAGARLHVDYAPAGWYVWRPLVKYEERQEAEKWPLVASPDRGAALAAARRLYSAATPEQIQRADGALAVTFLLADGKAIPFGYRPENFMLPAHAERN